MKLTARHLIRGKGTHRARRIPGQLTQQQFAHCPHCGVDTAATRHVNALLCTEGHLITNWGDQ